MHGHLGFFENLDVVELEVGLAGQLPSDVRDLPPDVGDAV